MDSSPIRISNANLSNLDPNDLLEEMGLLGVGVGNSPNPAPLLNTSIVQLGGLGGMIASASPLSSPARCERGRLGSQCSLNLSLRPSPPPSSPPPPIRSSTPRRRGCGCVKSVGKAQWKQMPSVLPTSDNNDDDDDADSNNGGENDLQWSLQMLLNDQRNAAAIRRISGITTTNTITTTYKDNGRPTVMPNSTSVRN